MSAKAKTAGRYVCPTNSGPEDCGECEAPFPHVREELVQRGQKIPSCESHNVKLVLAHGLIPFGVVGQLARVVAETAALRA